MKKYLKNISKKLSVHKTLIQNFSYLSALQVINLLLPLITYPYLIRVLGEETYGLVIFAQAVVGYLLILVQFGFNISATKEISIYRNNKKKLSEIVSSVLLIKSGLFILSAAILSLLILIIPKLHDYKTLFFLTLWLCLYDIIFPIWYFQGIEKMKYITYITLISRLTFLVLIFVLIHGPSDYLFIPVINGIGSLLAGVTSLFIIYRIYHVKLIIPPFSKLKHYFADSVSIFISNISVHLYLATNKILAGIFLGLSDVAYYDLAEKLLNLLKLPVTIVSQVLFPQMSLSYDKNLLKKSIRLVFFTTLIGIIVFQFAGDNLIILFAGAPMVPAANVTRILILSLIPLIISNGLGIQTLLSHGYNNIYTYINLQTTLLYFTLIAALIFINQLSVLTLPVVSIIIEIFLLISFFMKCKKLNLI